MTNKEVEIRQIEQKDFKKAIKFAEEGMNLSKYVNNKLELYFYSKYAFHQMLLRSTTVLGAYLNEKLVGFIFADFKGEEVVYDLSRYKIYCNLFTKFMKILGYQNASDSYEQANKEMLDQFRKNNPNIDGEITFFAVDLETQGKGVGTALLNELTRRNKNKLIYLFSDSGSTYQFYLHRDFKMFGKREIKLPLGEGKELPLTCFLFNKTL